MRPGSGHPQDLATSRTPVARDADDVTRLAATSRDLAALDARSSVCRACPRLVQWRERVAHDKRAAYADEDYWGRPVTGWGPADARVLVVGLAPAAHGGNRTGRVFTGDRSGDWLYAALHRAGRAAQPTSLAAGDGQALHDTRILVPVRCAPPGNAPTPQERDTCRGWLVRELALTLPTARAVVVLGGFGWKALLGALALIPGEPVVVPRPAPAFGHGVEVALERRAPRCARPLHLVGCYHVSQQNTFTGRLTEAMLDAVLARAGELAKD